MLWQLCNMLTANLAWEGAALDANNNLDPNHMPHFGGAAPSAGELTVWSWDPDNVLVARVPEEAYMVRRINWNSPHGPRRCSHAPTARTTSRTG